MNKVMCLLLLALLGCVAESKNFEDASEALANNYNMEQEALKSSYFKLPLSPDYAWGVSQSWGSHCNECEAKYQGTNYCQSSHMGSYTKYGWDFTLPGNADKGKPVLAAADGTVKTVVSNGLGDWGNYVIINHGDNVCTRYAHLLKSSITVIKDQQICQGLKIGEIGSTGLSTGEHLHFQFEKCDTKVPIAQGFGEDENYIPKCLQGNDVKTNPLQLTNFEKGSCGWVEVGSGQAPACPMRPACANKGTPSFGDQTSLDSRTTAAVDYLWRECAINGKSDGKFHPEDTVTRAEGLKMALELFGFTSCSGTEPFLDVKSTDWFYPYVVCAVKHGIVETKYTGFNPNGLLSFSDAAKILVLTASKAGKIEIKSPKVGHFAKIWKGHWAFNYFETIFHYGGVNFSMPEKAAGDKVKRGEMAVMAAALSPCFCQSMKCSDNAICNQETYSCETVEVITQQPPPDGKVGGGGDPPDVYVTKTDVVNSSEVSNLYADVQWSQPNNAYSGKGILPWTYCNAMEAEATCDGQAVVFPLKCELENPELQPMKVGSLTVEILEMDKNCQLLTDGKFQFNGMVIAPGAKGKTKAEFKVSCKEKLKYDQVNLNFYHDFMMPAGINWYMVEGGGNAPLTPQLFEKCKQPVCVANCLNKQCGDNGCGGNCGTCGSGFTCSSGKCAAIQTGWVCNPAEGYTMKVNSPGGIVEVLTGGSVIGYSKYDVTADTLTLKFYCEELPAMVLVTPGFPIVLVNAATAGSPNFSTWFPYTGSLVLNPKDKPTQFGTYFLNYTYEDAYPPKVLIKIPN